MIADVRSAKAAFVSQLRSGVAGTSKVPNLEWDVGGGSLRTWRRCRSGGWTSTPTALHPSSHLTTSQLCRSRIARISPRTSPKNWRS